MRKILLTLLIIALLFTPWASVKGQPENLLEEVKELVQKLQDLQHSGKYEEAIPYAQRLLGIIKRELPEDSSEVAMTITILANLYRNTGRYAEAEPLYKRALEINEKTFGKDHASAATTLDNLAQLYQVTARYSEAEPLFKRSLEIKEKALGRDHPDVALGLNNLALLYQNTGRYGEAEPLYKRSLEINEKALGKDNPAVAINLDNLAQLYQVTARYSEAEPLFKRSLEIKEKALGRDHPDVAITLNNLALLYKNTGRYAEAEPIYKRALEINEKGFGRDNIGVATILDNLAQLYQVTARYADAELLYKRSLEIKVKVLGKDHPDVAITLNNLALLYQNTGRYAEAEPIYKRALEINEKGFGRDNIGVATILDNLAQLYQVTARYSEAEPLCRRSLEIRERMLGKEHTDVGTSLNNLALLYSTTARNYEAEPLYKRSLEIYERVLGKDNPRVAKILNNLALLYAITNKAFESHMMFTRGITIEDRERENVFLLFSEKQKLNYITQTGNSIYIFITHTAQYMQLDNRAAKDTLDAWLRWKGAVMEAQGRYINAAMFSENPEIRKKFEDLTFIREAVARLQISGPGKMNIEEYKKRFEELDRKKESLESELNRLSKDFALEKVVGRADTKTISEVLVKKGKDCVYIDFANIYPYDFKENKFAKSRYLAFMLLPGKEPLVKLTDISDTEPIDTHIRAYLEEMRRAKEYGELPRERILKAEAKAIYEKVIKPIESEIKGKKHLYISPDGNLNLIPFEVLLDSEGKYLMEDHSITYVAAGRDIMRFTDTTVAQGDGLIMADPDYDMGLQEKTQVAKTMGIIETRGPAPITRDAKDLRFKRLPDTKKEANVVEKILRESYKTNVRNYQDKKALEEVLMTAKEPRVLHLATHGYFLKDEEVKHEPKMGFLSSDIDRMVDIGIENPMLRSGIVLAGVNASLKEGRDDGVVSAEKILGLRLKGTDLVVLSACDTGVGDVKSGEGVFGLKRSFILSGAKTVVMSLWSIPSKETTELMTDFYTLMAKGKTKAEALREARLNLMKRKPNPFYWGAFVMVGNPN